MAVSAGTPVQLVTSWSAAGTGRVRNQFVQVAGPRTVLSNAFATVTTFVAPDFFDGSTLNYEWLLYASNAQGAAVPQPVTVQVLSSTPRAATLQLAGGNQLLVLPDRFLEGGIPLTAERLVRLGKLSFLVRTAVGQDGIAGFETYLPGFGGRDFELGPDSAYLVRSAAGSAIPLASVPWPQAFAAPTVAPGLQLLANRVVDALGGMDAALAKTRSGFLAFPLAGAGQGVSFRAYVPGLSERPSLPPASGVVLRVTP
ncbi:MAG: hypothetical protein HY303_11835 [Candidatus Wallbacteria bacterium]|nr:hypothetical protein [Candidatus Wallbacteria bacterium]